MTKLTDMTMAEIEEKHDGQFILINDAGMVWDDKNETDVRALDVLVWDTWEESENDDGSKAVARYLIRDEE